MAAALMFDQLTPPPPPPPPSESHWSPPPSSVYLPDFHTPPTGRLPFWFRSNLQSPTRARNKRTVLLLPPLYLPTEW